MLITLFKLNYILMYNIRTLKISKMKNFKEDRKHTELKKLENINLAGWTYQGSWKYFGEVEVNKEIPSGFGRAVAVDDSRFIECYFRNG